jgi:hypothetical protein
MELPITRIYEAKIVFSNMTVCWVLVPFTLVYVYRRFKGACCFYLQGIDHGTKPPEDGRRRENNKS